MTDIDTAIGLLDKYKAIALSLGAVSTVVAIVITQGIKALVKKLIPGLPAMTVWLFSSAVAFGVFNAICRYTGQNLRDISILGIGILTSGLAPVAVWYLHKKYGIDLDKIGENADDDTRGPGDQPPNNPTPI